MKIYFNDVKIRAKKNKRILVKKISEVIERGTFFKGMENQKFTQKLTEYLGGGYVLTTASGHDALFTSLKSLKVSEEDEILFPVNSYPTAFPIAQSGGKPVPVDINEFGLIDPLHIAKKITKNTKAIVIVHLYGLVADIKSIKKLIKDKNIILIEDCAQAFGSKYLGKPVGVYGDISCFSFYPTKNLGAIGNAGALWTKHKKYYEYFKAASSYGERKRYQSEFIAQHNRLSEIQAGVLNVSIGNFNRYIKAKKNVLSFYNKAFDKNNLSNKIRLLYSNKDSEPCLHLLVIEVKGRNNLKKYLDHLGIPTFIHYPVSVHMVKAFDFLSYKKGSFPTSEKLSSRILSLPFHEYMTKNHIEHIVKSIRNFYGNK